MEIIQLSEFGEIDSALGFDFNDLWEESEIETAERRKTDSETAGNYVNMGALDPQEVREGLAHDRDSGFDNIDTSQAVVVDPSLETDPSDDDDPDAA